MRITGQAECEMCAWTTAHYTVSYDGITLDSEATGIMAAMLSMHTEHNHTEEVGA